MTNPITVTYREAESLHPSPEVLDALRKGQLSPEERLEVLGHIGRCERCAAYFAAGFEKTETLRTPANFAAEVQRKAQAQVPVVTDLIRPEAMKREFRRYCLKVACAACAAVILLLSGVFSQGVDLLSEASVEMNFSAVDNMADNIRDFSNLLFDPEVLQYDQNEK